MVVELDERENYGEDRFVAIGLLDGRVVVIVYSEPDAQTIRIISLSRSGGSFRCHQRSHRQFHSNRGVPDLPPHVWVGGSRCQRCAVHARCVGYAATRFRSRH